MISKTPPGLCNGDLIALGFKELDHFTIGKTVTYSIGRKRYLSATSVGQGNESLWLGHKDANNAFTDLICIHNRDYDGFLTIEKLKALIEWFKL